MSTALAGRVEGVLAGLSADERRALEHRERDQASYAEIATELGVRREQVADLLVGARLVVAEELDGSPPPPQVAPQCAPARRVAAAQQDGEPVTARDLDRAAEHFAACEACRAARLALQQARLACRGWVTAPPAPPAQRTRAAASAAPRRRLAIAAGAVVALLLVLAIAFGGDDDAGLPPAPAAPAVGEGSVDAESRDEIPPPGEQFCAPGEPNCEQP